MEHVLWRYKFFFNEKRFMWYPPNYNNNLNTVLKNLVLCKLFTFLSMQISLCINFFYLFSYLKTLLGLHFLCYTYICCCSKALRQQNTSNLRSWLPPIRLCGNSYTWTCHVYLCNASINEPNKCSES